MFADGETLLFDALCQSLDHLANQSGDDEALEERLYGLILLTDGQDAGRGTVSSEEAALACLEAAVEQRNIQTITIAYGAEADTELLGSLAEAGNGQSFIEFPDTIQERFLTIIFTK